MMLQGEHHVASLTAELRRLQYELDYRTELMQVHDLEIFPYPFMIPFFLTLYDSIFSLCALTACITYCSPNASYVLSLTLII